MTRWMRHMLFTSLVLALACGDDSGSTDSTTPMDGGLDMVTADMDTPTDGSVPDLLPDGGINPEADADADGLTNGQEGYLENVDTDGDGTPDFQDADSDDDRILDSIEAFAGDGGGPPPDSDDDGVPDWRDTDSDGNGREDLFDANLDENGIPEDLDDDGLENFRDPDDDNDGIPDVVEFGPNPDFPRDFDTDGIPDFQDIDSDDDLILDQHEFNEMAPDADGDGLPNYLDEDSDGDGFDDEEEAGDDILETFPDDTDLDTIPDFIDLDSDGDGLSDEFEGGIGSNPRATDTDGDMVDDLIEIGGQTDPLDPEDNPRVRGDFVFVVPFRQPAQPEEDTLRFRTNIRVADIYFQFDITGSMIAEIREFRARVVELIDQASCDDSFDECLADANCDEGQICGLGNTCIEDPELTGCIANLWTGVGYYAGGGSSYRNLLSLQPSPELTQETVPVEANGPGGAESLFESAACISDRRLCIGAACGAGGVGCPSFRRDAVRIALQITDEDNQCNDSDDFGGGGDFGCPVVNTAGAAGGRLQLNRINYIGINATGSTTSTAYSDLVSLAVAAGSISPDGEPFVYSGRDAAAVDAILEGIQEIADQLELFVDIDARDLDGDAGDALQFIDRLAINLDAAGCDEPDEDLIADTNDDGFEDAFRNLPTGVRACWDVVVRPNRTVPATTEPQVFEAAIEVFGDSSPLDRRRVFFLIPPDNEICGPDDTRPQCQD